jgi:hypothetical protein
VIAAAVTHYAHRFHRVLGGRHGVASPFGAWLLLALVAPAATGEHRSALADILGCDPDDAFAAATRLLHEPHTELVLGAAAWHDADVETEPLLHFLRRLAAHVSSGPMPTQAEADAWAQKHTGGLINRFPLDARGNVVLMLATAIAAKVTWYLPFRLAAADSAVLPADPEFAGKQLLRDPGARAWCGFAHTDAGLLAGYIAPSQGGLYVMSAIGERAADPAAVLDATQKLVCAVSSGAQPEPVSLFDLRLGDGVAWRITEETTSYVGSPERYEVLLPAWEAHSEHPLLPHDLGFAEAGDALIALLPPTGYYTDARQIAMARYTREGFEAAAVTGMAVTSSAPARREGRVRRARIEFTRPHAVVAATRGAGDWDGLPVFSAWVAEAVPAE